MNNQLTRQPVLVLARNPVLQNAVISDLMAETNRPFLFTPEPADFVTAFNLRTLVLIDEELADRIAGVACQRVPGWLTGRFRPQFHDFVLLTESIDGDLDDLRPLQQSIRAGCIVRVPFQNPDLQRLRKQIMDLDPPF